jgi:type VI protein secretion system component Hcp
VTVITKPDQSASWNAITNTSGFPGLIDAPPTLQGQTISPSGSPGDLTYYVQFNLNQTSGESQDTGPLDGSTLYQLNSFSFDVQNTSSIGSATGGASAGKVTFNPLNLVLSQPSLTPTLFQMLAAGTHFTSIDVLGVKQDGTLATDDTFKFVAPTDLSTGSSGETAVGLDFGALSIRYFPQSATGSPAGSPVSGSWNVVTNTSDSDGTNASDSAVGASAVVSESAPTTLQGQTISPSVNPDLTYYVRFTLNQTPGESQHTGPLDGSTLYQLNSFSFDVQNTSSIGSATGGASTGKAVFNPLDLVLNQPLLTPVLFQALATGAHFQQVDVLGYQQDGTLATDDSFGLAFDTSLSTNNQGDMAVALDYGRLSIQTYSNLDVGTFTAVTPATVERGQTTVVGTVTLGFDGESLAVTQTAGSGTLSLGQLSNGIQQILYTAPSSITVSAVDSVSYAISDQFGDTVATSLTSVQLDAGPSFTSVTPSVVEKGQTTEVGTVTPGLAGDTLTLQQTGGSGALALQLVNGVEEVIYTAPSAIAASTLDTVSYTISDQHNDAVATASASVQLDAGPTITTATPAVVEKGQTTVIGTVTEGLVGDALTLTQAPGSLGVLTLGPVLGGVQQVIYTAPSSIGASTLDAVSYTISDQHTDVIASGSNTVPLAPATDTINVGTAGGLLNVGNGDSAVDGRAGNEKIQAGNGVDVVFAGPNDTISLGNGKDTVLGGSNDTIQVGNGTDSISTGANSRVIAGNGADTLAVGDKSTVALGNGNDTVTIGANASITGGNGQDAVTAGANAKIILGNGNDTVTAGSDSNITLGNGNNTVSPGANSTVTLGNGHNTVFADQNDTITVGNGQNQLVAAPGDVWTVGKGNDTFAFNAGSGNNTITDFNAAHDVLQFNTSLIANYAAAMTDIKQVGHDTVITEATNDTVTLTGVAASQLTASNFKFT